MEVITLLEKLETFKIVYETQNFSKAAELLFVSQPTVSAHIKQLEEELSKKNNSSRVICVNRTTEILL